MPKHDDKQVAETRKDGHGSGIIITTTTIFLFLLHSARFGYRHPVFFIVIILLLPSLLISLSFLLHVLLLGLATNPSPSLPPLPPSPASPPPCRLSPLLPRSLLPFLLLIILLLLFLLHCCCCCRWRWRWWWRTGARGRESRISPSSKREGGREGGREDGHRLRLPGRSLWEGAWYGIGGFPGDA